MVDPNSFIGVKFFNISRRDLSFFFNVRGKFYGEKDDLEPLNGRPGAKSGFTTSQRDFFFFDGK